jgi:PleD family two-component response regulator
MGIARGGKWMPIPKVLALNADKSACGEQPSSLQLPAESAPMSTNEFEIRDIRLLLVEDNPADARVVERHLKDAGLNRVTSDWVQTAADAAQRLTTTEYDLVLLDLGLPDATGLQALRALRAIAAYNGASA